jgi:kinesin family protein 6/9
LLLLLWLHSRKVYSLDEWLRVIDVTKASASQITKTIGVGKTQFQKLMLNKEKILQLCIDNNVHGNVKRKRKPVHEDVDQLCVMWVHDAVKRRMPVSGPLIQTQALKFARELGINGLKASNGWLFFC